MKKSIFFICAPCLLLTLAACGDNRTNTEHPDRTDTMDNATMYPDNTYDGTYDDRAGTDTALYRNNAGDTERVGNQGP